MQPFNRHRAIRHIIYCFRIPIRMGRFVTTRLSLFLSIVFWYIWQNCFLLPLFQAHHFRLYIRPCFCKPWRGTYLIAQIAKVSWKACRLPYGQRLWLVSRKMLQEQPKMFWILCSFCRLPKFFVLSFQIGYRRARSARFGKVKANLFGSSPMPSWFWFISLLSSSKMILTNRETTLTLHVQVSTNRTPTRQKPFVANLR